MCSCIKYEQRKLRFSADSFKSQFRKVSIVESESVGKIQHSHLDLLLCFACQLNKLRSYRTGEENISLHNLERTTRDEINSDLLQVNCCHINRHQFPRQAPGCFMTQQSILIAFIVNKEWRQFSVYLFIEFNDVRLNHIVI